MTTFSSEPVKWRVEQVTLAMYRAEEQSYEYKFMPTSASQNGIISLHKRKLL